MNSYPFGEMVTVSVVFVSKVTGEPEDPDTVSLQFKSPCHVISVIPSGDITRDSTGNYHYGFLPTAPGYWSYRFEGTGAVEAAEETMFEVLAFEF